jgi:hypothetical protein
MENKYHSSKIYKLVCNDGYYYIGSTIQELNNRLNNHKKLSKTGVNKVYNYINSIGWDNVEIELIEKYKCNSKQELNNREEYYLNNSKQDDLCLNFKNINIYENGKIYKLLCDDGHYYIGSTTQKLYNRFNHHKFSAKTGTSKAYTYINSIGWDKVKIELVEDFPCNIKSELNEREEYHISKSKSDELCLNINSALLTPEERKENMKKYYEENKEKIIEQHKDYIQENKEKVDEYQAQYRLDNAEKRRDYTRQYAQEHTEQIKEAKKKYNEENKDKIAQYWKDYAKKEENKEKLREIKRRSALKIKEQNAEKIAKEKEEKQKLKEEKKQARIEFDKTIVQCPCGGSYQNYQKKRHEESKKHQKFINN